MLVADIVRLAHRSDETLIVLAQLRQHVERIDIGRVVVGDTLVASNVADRTQRGPPTLRTRSAITSVMAKICSDCSSSNRW